MQKIALNPFRKDSFMKGISKNSFVAEFLKAAVIFMAGGFIYGAIEILYRGHTHPSMFVLGGLSLLWVGGLNSFFGKNPPILLQMAIGSAIITLGEFVCGVVVNLWLGMEVWDYSKMPFNIMGQVCLLFVFIWFFLSLPAILVEDYMRSEMFREPKRVYKRLLFRGAVSNREKLGQIAQK